MAKQLTQKAGEHDYNSIIASSEPALQTTTLKLTRSSSADIPAGTVLVQTGQVVNAPASESAAPTVTAAATSFAPIAKALTGADLVLVLAEDVEKGSGEVAVTAYKAGNFVRSYLRGFGTYKLVTADYRFLSQAGILSEDVID